MTKFKDEDEECVECSRMYEKKMLKRLAGYVSKYNIMHSVRNTMRERRERSSLYQNGYIPTMRTSTPTMNRDSLRHIIRGSDSQLDQFINNKQIQQQLIKWWNKTTPQYKDEWTDTRRPRGIPAWKYQSHVCCITKETRSNVTSGKSRKGSNDANTSPQQLGTEHSIGEESEYNETKRQTGTESLSSEDIPDVSGVINAITDTYSANRQNDINSVETNSEIYQHDAKVSDIKKRRVRFSDDTVAFCKTSANVMAEHILEGQKEDKLKATHSETNKSKELIYDFCDRNDEAKKVKGILSHNEQWQNSQADGDRNLRSYQLNETKPRMYESQSKDSPAQKEAKDTSFQTRTESAKTSDRPHRITSAKSRYGNLILNDVIRNENIDIKVRLENALPVIDTWNTHSVRARPAVQIEDIQVPVLDPSKNGSVVHYQQTRQTFAENQARLSNTRSKTCSWQSGQIMSLLTAGQAKDIKEKRKLH